MQQQSTTDNNAFTIELDRCSDVEANHCCDEQPDKIDNDDYGNENNRKNHDFETTALTQHVIEIEPTGEIFDQFDSASLI